MLFKYNRTWYFLLMVFGFSNLLTAQQLPLFTQYRDNHGLINPAIVQHNYPIYEYNVSIGASYRYQWLNKSNSPQTQVLRGEYLFKDLQSVGLLLGGYLINDQTGPTGFTGAYGRIAGILSDDPYFGGLSVGLNFGMVQYRVKGTEIEFLEAGEMVSNVDYYKLHPDVGAGIYYYKNINSGIFEDDIFYGGLSIPQVFGFNLNYTDDRGDFQIRRLQHFYALLGWYNNITDNSFIETSSWIKYSPYAPINVDVNIRYQMQQNFWIGCGVSSNRSFHLETGVLISNLLSDDSFLKIGYGYSHGFNEYGPSFGDSHELNISYIFDSN